MGLTIFILIVIIILLCIFLYNLYYKTYKRGRITHKYFSTDNINSTRYDTRYNYYFIVNFISRGTPKSKTILVTKEVFDLYEVDGIITI